MITKLIPRSKFVAQILDDISTDVNSWKPYEDGIQKGGIKIYNLAIIVWYYTTLCVSGNTRTTITNRDACCLYKAVKWYFKNADLSAIKGGEI